MLTSKVPKMDKKMHEYNQIKITPDDKEAILYIRYLDLALMNTNIHAFLPPRALRRPTITPIENNVIKINLNQIQDVLPPIKKKHRNHQKEWRINWAKFINQIYEHSLQIKEHQSGYLWLKNPSILLDSLDTFFPTCKEMTSYKQFVKNKLKILVKQRTRPVIIQRIKRLRILIETILEKHKHLEKIKFYAPYMAGNLLLEALKGQPYLAKVNQIILLDPITGSRSNSYITSIKENKEPSLIILKGNKKYPFQETETRCSNLSEFNNLLKKEISYPNNIHIPTGGRIINPALEKIVKEIAL